MREVERLKDELDCLQETVRNSGSISDMSSMSEVAVKALLLAAASFFEERVCTGIVEAFAECNTTHSAISLIEKKAIKRNYHTFFDWKSSNINSFLMLFGDDFKTYVSENIDEESLQSSSKRFIILGRERNKLVHNNYAVNTIDLTYDEVWTHFIDANKLVDEVIVLLSSYSSR